MYYVNKPTNSKASGLTKNCYKLIRKLYFDFQCCRRATKFHNVQVAVVDFGYCVARCCLHSDSDSDCVQVASRSDEYPH